METAPQGQGQISSREGSASGISSVARELTIQQVAEQTGLSVDQVSAFCRDFNVPKHYVLTPELMPQIEGWAREKGYTLRT